ncbi:MAG: hypothetical protein SGBAC_003974 [Bacillariaceae sp.]
MLVFLSFLLLLAFAAAQPMNIDGATILDPVDFKAGLDAGEYDAVIDVRSQSEWDDGHIEGATLALNMASYPSDEVEHASPQDFAGSGARASDALQHLIDAGFNGTLYNGQGINQWQAAGYSLVNGTSMVPPCTVNEVGQCAAPTPAPSASMAPSAPVVPVTVLEPGAIKNGIDNGEFDAIIDVRRQDEWDTGHIEGATFAINLAIFGDTSEVTASPADFLGCETCTLLVYCRAGPRATAAIEKLIAAGFNGTLYNGQGTRQWEEAGFPLFTTDSVVPPCTKSEVGTCVAPTDPPTMAPTIMTATGNTPEESASSMHSWPMVVLVAIFSAFVV